MRKPFWCLIAVLALSIPACTSEHASRSDPEIRKRLAAEAERKRTSDEKIIIHMRSITPFDWDRLFIFGPYTPSSEIDERLGFHWQGVSRVKLADRDDISLLLFVQKSRVVEDVEQPLSEGDFSEVNKEKGFTLDDAIFEVRRVDRGGPWIIMQPLQ